jgi:hypothetical protein
VKPYFNPPPHTPLSPSAFAAGPHSWVSVVASSTPPPSSDAASEPARSPAPPPPFPAAAAPPAEHEDCAAGVVVGGREEGNRVKDLGSNPKKEAASEEEARPVVKCVVCLVGGARKEREPSLPQNPTPKKES